MTSLRISWPPNDPDLFFHTVKYLLFFFFSSLSFSFPVRTCLWFAVLFCTSDKVFWTMLHKSKSFQPVEGARPDEIWSNILSAPSVRRSFSLFFSFLWTGNMKRGWAQVTRLGWVPVCLLGLSVQIIWQGEVAATTAAGRFSCSRVIRSRCTHLLTLADNFLGWELRNCLQMKRVLGIFFSRF